MNVPGVPENYDKLKSINCDNKNCFELLNKYYQYANIKYFKELIIRKKIDDDIIRESLIFNNNYRIIFTINDELKIDSIYKKVINTNFNGFANIIIQYYALKYKQIVPDILINYKKILDQYKYKDYVIYVYLVDNKNNIKNDNVFKTEDFYSTFTLGNGLFHEKSLEYYKLLKFTPFLYGSKNCYENLNIFLSKMVDNFDIIGMKRYIIFSSLILSLTGLRYCRDVDVILSLSKKEKNYLMIEKFLKEVEKSNKDIGIANETKPVSYFRLEKDGFKSYERWAKTTGAKNIDEMILDPKFHWYFLGIKMTTFEFEVNKKNERPFPKSILDLILFKKFLKVDNILPDLEVKFFKRIQEQDVKYFGNISQIKYLVKNKIDLCIYYKIFLSKVYRLIPRHISKKIIINIFKERYLQNVKCS